MESDLEAEILGRTKEVGSERLFTRFVIEYGVDTYFGKITGVGDTCADYEEENPVYLVVSGEPNPPRTPSAWTTFEPEDFGENLLTQKLERYGGDPQRILEDKEQREDEENDEKDDEELTDLQDIIHEEEDSIKEVLQPGRTSQAMNYWPGEVASQKAWKELEDYYSRRVSQVTNYWPGEEATEEAWNNLESGYEEPISQKR